MTVYRIEFGKVGDTQPVPPLELTADSRDALVRQVTEHAIPYLKPVLAKEGHPEYADCFFRTDRDLATGHFMWLDLAAARGALFCPARITTP